MAAPAPTPVPSPVDNFEEYKAYCMPRFGNLVFNTVYAGELKDKIINATKLFAFINGIGKEFVLFNKKLCLTALSKGWGYKGSGFATPNLIYEIDETITLLHEHTIPIPHGNCGECRSCCMQISNMYSRLISGGSIVDSHPVICEKV